MDLGLWTYHAPAAFQPTPYRTIPSIEKFFPQPYNPPCTHGTPLGTVGKTKNLGKQHLGTVVRLKSPPMRAYTPRGPVVLRPVVRSRAVSWSQPAIACLDLLSWAPPTGHILLQSSFFQQPMAAYSSLSQPIAGKNEFYPRAWPLADFFICVRPESAGSHGTRNAETH